MNCIPAGMELWPSDPATSWEVIRRVVDCSDYYVLIIGGIYGSTNEDGISYTEQEYDYARPCGIPIAWTFLSLLALGAQRSREPLRLPSLQNATVSV